MSRWICSSNKTGTAYVVDSLTGASTISFTNNVSNSNSTVVVTNSDSEVVYVISCQDKPILRIWRWGSHLPLHECGVQEILTSCVMDPSNHFVYCGGKSGRIYTWNIVSGTLLRVWRAHYKSVIQMSFSKDGNLLISSSLDAQILSWSRGLILDSYTTNLAPFSCFRDHSLEIIQFCVYSQSHVLSISKDGTMAQFDATNIVDKHITRLDFIPSACAIADHPKSLIFLSSSSSPQLYVNNTQFQAHDAVITHLMVNSTHLVSSSSSDGMICVWSIQGETISVSRVLYLACDVMVNISPPSCRSCNDIETISQLNKFTSSNTVDDDECVNRGNWRLDQRELRRNCAASLRDSSRSDDTGDVGELKRKLELLEDENRRWLVLSEKLAKKLRREGEINK